MVDVKQKFMINKNIGGYSIEYENLTVLLIFWLFDSVVYFRFDVWPYSSTPPVVREIFYENIFNTIGFEYLSFHSFLIFALNLLANYHVSFLTLNVQDLCKQLVRKSDCNLSSLTAFTEDLSLTQMVRE